MKPWSVYSLLCALVCMTHCASSINDRVNPEGITHFAGWARMALPITTFSIVEVNAGELLIYLLLLVSNGVWYIQVGKPKVGENRPSRVKADITIELTVNDTVKREWEGLSTIPACVYLCFLWP